MTNHPYDIQMTEHVYFYYLILNYGYYILNETRSRAKSVNMPMKTVISVNNRDGQSRDDWATSRFKRSLTSTTRFFRCTQKTWIKIQNSESNTPGVSWASHQWRVRAFYVSGAHGRTNNKDGRPHGKHDVK